MQEKNLKIAVSGTGYVALSILPIQDKYIEKFYAERALNGFARKLKCGEWA